jgi:hypothetical protein
VNALTFQIERDRSPTVRPETDTNGADEIDGFDVHVADRVVVFVPRPAYRMTSGSRALAALAFLCGLTAAAGCAQPPFTDKHTAEEAGYLSRVRSAFVGTCRIGTTESRQTGMSVMQAPCGGDQRAGMCNQWVPVYSNVTIEWLSDTGVNSIDVSTLLERTLPPAGLSEAQALLTETLALDAKRDAQLHRRAPLACKAFGAFEESVRARTKSYQTTESVYISYQPIGPVEAGVKYDTRSGFGFTLDESLTIPTPYGNLTVGYKAPPGIHMLRIVSEGKQRFLTLDRPFEFFIPTGYSTNVVFEGNDELILRVNKG